jgi:hypothetical protein
VHQLHGAEFRGGRVAGAGFTAPVREWARPSRPPGLWVGTTFAAAGFVVGTSFAVVSS